MFFLKLFLTVWTAGATEGTFYNQDVFEIVQAKRTELTSTQTAAGKKKMNELKKRGYLCRRQNPYFMCRKFLKDLSFPDGLEIESNRKVIQFGPIVQKTTLSEGTEVLQFLARQQVQVDDRNFHQARYTRTSNVEKIDLGMDSNSPIHFILRNDMVVELLFPRISESKMAWTEYIIESYFMRDSRVESP